jgi:hypothetical protein
MEVRFLPPSQLQPKGLYGSLRRLVMGFYSLRTNGYLRENGIITAYQTDTTPR